MGEAARQQWPEVMDLTTAARYLGCHPVTLRDWKRLGKGPPGRKMVGRWRFSRTALDAYLTGCPAPPTNSSPEARKGRSTSGSRHLTDAKYLEALGLPIAPSRRNGRRGSTPTSTESRD